jgi:hypothetical protein
MQQSTAVLEHDDAPFAPSTAVATVRADGAPLSVMDYAAGNVVMTPMVMLARALDKGADMAVLEKLFALNEKWEAAQAKKAFNAAIAAAKAEMPQIVKDRVVDFKNSTGARTNYQHEDLAGIAAVIDPVLGKHGLFYRFRTSNAGGKVVVTCILSHKDGHSEENTLEGAPDKSGGKNDIQAIGSVSAYLQRYTLKPALGLAAAHDDDGQAAGGRDTAPDRPAPRSAPVEQIAPELIAQKITTAQVDRINALLAEKNASTVGFLNWVRKSVPSANCIEDIPAACFHDCEATLLGLARKAD